MKWFKRILKILSIGILLLLIAGATITFFYAEELEKLVLEKVSEQLKEPVKYSDVEFSLWKKFPMATVGVYNVVAKSTNGHEENLINLEEIYLSFNWWQIFSETLTLDEISLENGNVTIHQNKNGDWNFDLFTSDNDTTNTSSGFIIDDVILKDVRLVYCNEIQAQTYDVQVAKANIHLSKVERKLEIDGGISLTNNRVLIGDWENVQNFPLETTFAFVKDERSNQFIIEDGLLNKQRFDVSVDNKEDILCEFQLYGADFLSVVQILPPNQIDFADWSKTSGKLSLTGKYSTDASAENLMIDFTTSKGSLLFSEKYPLSNVNIEGKIATKHPSDLRNYELKIEAFEFDISASHFSGNLRAKNLERPSFSGRGQGKLNLKDWTSEISQSINYTADGTIQFNTDFSGTYDFENSDWLKQVSKFNTKGDIRLKDLQLISPENIVFKDINALLSFNNKDLKLESAEGLAQSTKFKLRGTMYSYLQTIFEDKPLSIVAAADIERFDLNEFLVNSDSTQQSAESELNIPENLNFEFKLNMEEFVFNHFKAEDISGDVWVKDQKLTLNNMKMKTSEGSVNLKGRLDASSDAQIKYDCFADLRDINIKQFFTSFDNFGQDFLLDRHLSGKLSTTIDFLAVSDKAMNIDLSKLYTLADIRVVNGELTNFEPLIELQDYLKEEWKLNYDFSKLKFQTIQNKIEIANERIDIPEMDIASNSINLKVSGWHSFNHDIEYLLKIKHSEIFKVKRQNVVDTKYGVIEDDGKSATLPLLMHGNVDDPQFSYDFSTKKEIIHKNIKEEKKEIKNALEKERASWNKEVRDSIKQEEQNKKTKFEVIWDEE
jgi:hypothetical protein